MDLMQNLKSVYRNKLVNHNLHEIEGNILILTYRPIEVKLSAKVNFVTQKVSVTTI